MDRLLATLTSRQITEWLAYAQLEPFGPLTEARQFGTVAAAVVNHAGFGRPRGAQPAKPEDFFAALRADRAARRMTAAEIQAEMEKIAPAAARKRVRESTDPLVVKIRAMMDRQRANAAAAKKSSGLAGNHKKKGGRGG